MGKQIQIDIDKLSLAESKCHHVVLKIKKKLKGLKKCSELKSSVKFKSRTQLAEIPPADFPPF